MGSHPRGLGAAAVPSGDSLYGAVGAMLGVVVVVLLGEGVRIWLARYYGGKGGRERQGFIYRVWRRYGVMGLGLLAPLLTGAPLGAVLGLALGAPVNRLLLWISLGIVLWSAGLTLVGALGLAGIEGLWR